jgi:leader peptidase (prepilin peptidase)/N-methyltransferase
MSGGEAALAGLAFLWGASWGSFANVVAWRLPRGVSIVRPASHCPACESPVPWWGNLPVLGWCLVGGRCRSCRNPVSARYPLVEAVVGVAALAIWLRLVARAGPDGAWTAGDPGLEVFVPFVLATCFVAGLVALSLIDLAWFLLPDSLTLSLTVLGLGAAAASPGPPTLAEAALGAVLGGGLPAAVMVVWLLLTGRDGLGGGDWKLLAAVGAWLGPASIPFVLGAGAIQGLATALLFRRDFAVAELPPLPGEGPEEEPEDEPEDEPEATAQPEAAARPFMRLAVPFGPFLALAAFEWLLFGDDLLALAKG